MVGSILTTARTLLAHFLSLFRKKKKEKKNRNKTETNKA